MRAIIVIFLLSWLGAPLISFAQATLNPAGKADKILRGAREAIYKNVKSEEVKGFKIIKNSQTTINKMPSVRLEKTIEISFPDQIKLTLKTLLPSFDGVATNYRKRVLTSNGQDVSVHAFVSFDGDEEKINERDALKRLGLSKKDIEKRLRDKREKLETKKNSQEEAWIEVFPLFLKDPWEAERKFIFIGSAKVGGKTKKVIDYFFTEDEKDSQNKAGGKDFIRLFFDEKTLLLTHLQGELWNTKLKVDVKCFFSDYQLMDGLLIAKKINMEAIVTRKDGSKQRIVQQITVKDFKLNPVFKAGTFEVKK